MQLWQRVKEINEAHQEFLLKYKWEWFGSFTVPISAYQRVSVARDSFIRKYKIGCPEAEFYLKEWRSAMGIKNHMLFAYMGVFNTVPQPHIHLLLLGKKNRYGKTLLDLSPKVWEAAWSGLTKCQAVIQPLYLIYDRDQVASYIANKNLHWDRSDKNLPQDKSELIQPYNPILRDRR